jgi:choline-sulfatase
MDLQWRAMKQFPAGLGRGWARAATWPALTLILATVSCGGEQGRLPPDILLITLDTVRADRLGAYGGDPRVSPNLDRLAGRGRIFMSCDTASPLTLPSHATMLTGLYPPAHGLRSNGRGRLPEATPTLALRLKAHGYATAAFVSSVILNHVHGLDRGFDTYDDRMGPAGERPGDATVDAALAWWQQSREQPAFLWVHLFDPHAPYRPPPPWPHRFPGRPYDGEIAFMDAQIGRLLEGVESGGRELVVAVAGDHGEGLGEHGEQEHGLLLYQSTLAVPCLVAAPGITAGRTTRPARTLDLMPTLLARAHIPSPANLPGRDLLVPLPAEATAPDAYAETLLPWEDYGWHPLFAARRGRVKVQQGAFTSIHDLSLDPRELGHPAGQEQGPAGVVAEELMAVIQGQRHTRPQRPAATLLPSTSREQLRSLGYLAGSAGPPPSAPGPGLKDPRQQTVFHDRVTEVLAAYRDGRSEVAAEILAILMEEEPGNPFLRDLAGSVEMARGNPAGAADHFAAALAHTPDRGAVEIHLAEALLAQNLPQEAEARCRHALASLPDPPPIRAILALCQAVADQGRVTEARACAGDFLSSHQGVETSLVKRLRILAGQDIDLQ